MPIIDHITYEIEQQSSHQRTHELLHSDSMTLFFELLGFVEIPADEEINQGWDVRWFAPAEGQQGIAIHLVVRPDLRTSAAHMRIEEQVELGLGHFCVGRMGAERYARCQKSVYLEHDSALGVRCWLRGPGGIRVECRP